MARILIVGCGGRGQALARELVAAGHTVRGTTRSSANVEAIAAAGAEPYVGDPDRIATLMEALAAVSVVVYLMGRATGPGAEELHGGRLRMLCEKLVDTPVRGLIYEAGGTARAEALIGGAEIVRAAAATWNIPVHVLQAPPSHEEAWMSELLAAVGQLLAG